MKVNIDDSKEEIRRKRESIWKSRYENVTLDVEPDQGVKGNIVEYCFHQGDFIGNSLVNNSVGLDFHDAKDWREVKKILKTCIEYAKVGKIYNEIVCIEKVWHIERESNWENWSGYCNLFHLKDFEAAWGGIVSKEGVVLG